MANRDPNSPDYSFLMFAILAGAALAIVTGFFSLY